MVGAKKVCDILLKNGFEAYLVGGCVRDMLMSRVPKDYDITTNALPNEIQAIFPNHIDTGLKHGTVTVRPRFCEEFYEVTTYRIDGQYDDGRHPNEVQFTPSLVEDLLRRDFTMNAIAFNPITEEFVDPYEGKADIENKVICAVGDAKARFMEDPLRVLRGMRFAIKYGFNIEDNTKAAMHDKEVLAKLADCISKERITDELRKMLVCNKPIHDVFMEFADIIKVIMPIFYDVVPAKHNSKWHPHDIYEHILCVVDLCDTDDFVIKMAALLHDIGKPASRVSDDAGYDHFYNHPVVSKKLAEEIFNEDLKLPNVEVDEILVLVEIHDNAIPTADKSIRKMIAKYGEQLVRKWIILKGADIADHIAPVGGEERFQDLVDSYNIFKNKFEDVLRNSNVLHMRDLAINGRDIMARGIAEGPKVGELMRKAFDAVLNEEVVNDKDALLKFLNL